MLVLKGTKQISGPVSQQCNQGNMLLVSNGYEFPFANIPNEFYMALIIEFDPDDFPFQNINENSEQLAIKSAPEEIMFLTHQLMGLHNKGIPSQVLISRRKELAQLISHLGLDQTLRCPINPSWQSRVANLLQSDLSKEWKLEEVCKALATSESNIRRKLQDENTGFRELLENLRLTLGLNMLQTTHLPINQVALECGYQSASRFSERFKKRFRTTPRELRQAR